MNQAGPRLLFRSPSTMDGGMSILCWEKYWQRSAKRAFLLRAPFAQQATNSAIVHTRYGRQVGPPRRPARTCRARRVVASDGASFRLATSLFAFLLYSCG